MPTPSDFELQVLRWISLHTGDPALRRQLEVAQVLDREYTGAGCYSRLRVPDGVPVTAEIYGERGPLTGPGFASDRIEGGGGTLLWFDGGRMHTLKVHAYGGTFPEDHSDLGELRLEPPPRLCLGSHCPWDNRVGVDTQ